MPEITWKNVGETPLECLNRFRAEGGIDKSVPLSYAGRLDPLAEGKLLILTGDECRDRGRYLSLDKEYEVEVVFGFRTDSYDALGIPERGKSISISSLPLPEPGRFTQKYPPYSSKTVGGVALHELARMNRLPANLPEKEVEIYSVREEGRGEISAAELKRVILEKISLVKGDFRRDLIGSKWTEILSDVTEAFPLFRLSVKCSSGTYMRSLANRLGELAGSGAFAFSITRTGICLPPVLD